MNRFRKAIAAGMSAALVASLLTFIAATAFASTAVVSAGIVPRGGTSATAASFTFTENDANEFSINGTLIVTIVDKAGNSTVHFTGTPVLTAPASLGASISVATGGNSFTVTTTGHDDNNVEQITVSGLKIKADSGTGTALGAITATLTGTLASFVTSGSATATGTLQTSVIATATSVAINVTSTCNFAVTGAGVTPAGQLIWGTIADSKNITAAPAPVSGVQTLTVAALASAHTAGEAVSQTVDNCAASTLTSPGTVADVVVQDTGVPANVNPGEQNQDATATKITELTAGYIPVGTLTYTLSAAGVQFSKPPTVSFTAPVVPPVGLTATPSTTGGTLAAGTYCYGVTTKTGLGETPDGSIACATTTGATGSVVLTWTAAIGATGYNIDGRPATSAGPFGLIGTVSAPVVTFTDVGTPAPGAVPPTVSTAGDTTLSLFAIGSACNLSFDRMSCSVAVTHVSVSPVVVLLSDIQLDVASTVAAGTIVNAVVTSSPAINVKVNSNNIANVARVVVGTAAQPLIYINYNDQSTGQISLTEAAAAYFQAGTGANNRLTVCITTDESFTRAPWAVVTAGDLKLLDGLVGGTSVIGTLSTTIPGHVGQSCAYWTVYTGSTVASTIQIRGSDSAGVVLPDGALNGPRVSVPGSAVPGTTQMVVLSGDGDTLIAVLGLVSNATRAYKSGVVATAVTQPVIPAGTPDSLAGNLKLTETLNGQFKANEEICVAILPRTTNGFTHQDTFMTSANTNGLPIITTNFATTGLLASSVASLGCDSRDEIWFLAAFGVPLSESNAFSFHVTQQAFGALGEITISNIHYATTADAPAGNVLVSVFSFDPAASGSEGVAFQSNVSNARIGSQLAGTAKTRLGVTQTGAFTISTKLPHLNKYVTYRFDFGIGAAGALIDILGAAKTGNDWSAFTKKTSRLANASGVVYYYIRSASPAWWSFRAAWGAGGVMTPARQAHWIP